MSIITISRGSLHASTEVAEMVATELGIPCVSREVVVAAAQAAGINELKITEQLDEKPTRLFARYFKEREIYLWFLRSELYQYASRGGFVYHGHGGHLLLSDISCLLRIQVVAPIDNRVRSIMKSKQYDETAAKKYVNQIDSWRNKWMRHLYDVDWYDPSQFDQIFNIDKINTKDAGRLIIKTSQLACFRENENTKEEIENALLIARTKAALAKSGELFTSLLEITSLAGTLSIAGKTRSAKTRDKIYETVQEALAGAPFERELVIAKDEISWRDEAV
ncbi:MAG TPA: hypothetical protein DCZ03_03235 [Gammaproteobacteria bacterium]|nr:hypothetical protein [Gammaproteobacteria bacterium]